VRKHDVVVIGGSLAGAACVRELDRFGVDAVAFERDRFPRPKVCGGFISPGGVECLDRLGVLDDVLRGGATRVRSATVRVEDTEVDIEFEREGLGISRHALDGILAASLRVEQCCAVTSVARTTDGFLVSGPAVQVSCRVVIDAAGKLSRITRRRPVSEYGLQFRGSGTKPGVLEFWFFDDGYGGGVRVENGEGNFCFLINKDRLGRYLDRPGCLVTGPLAYEPVRQDYIAIGDAVGMIDPFCGEGMRHALDSGMTAARAVARGLRDRRGYDEVRREYELESSRRWGRKREVGAVVRRLLKRRNVMAVALRRNPKLFLDWMWR
jgi:menaquinone-9 beta-reductase